MRDCAGYPLPLARDLILSILLLYVSLKLGDFRLENVLPSIQLYHFNVLRDLPHKPSQIVLLFVSFFKIFFPFHVSVWIFGDILLESVA